MSFEVNFDKHFIRKLRTRTYLFSLHFHHKPFLTLDITGRWANLNQTFIVWSTTCFAFKKYPQTARPNFTKAASSLVVTPKLSHKPVRRAYRRWCRSRSLGASWMQLVYIPNIVYVGNYCWRRQIHKRSLSPKLTVSQDCEWGSNFTEKNASITNTGHFCAHCLQA